MLAWDMRQLFIFIMRLRGRTLKYNHFFLMIGLMDGKLILIIFRSLVLYVMLQSLTRLKIINQIQRNEFLLVTLLTNRYV